MSVSKETAIFNIKDLAGLLKTADELGSVGSLADNCVTGLSLFLDGEDNSHVTAMIQQGEGFLGILERDFGLYPRKQRRLLAPASPRYDVTELFRCVQNIYGSDKASEFNGHLTAQIGTAKTVIKDVLNKLSVETARVVSCQEFISKSGAAYFEQAVNIMSEYERDRLRISSQQNQQVTKIQ